MNLNDKTLALCFSQGVSLEEWRRKGLFDREVQIYNRIAPEMESVQFHTYGSPDEANETDGLDPAIQVHPNRLRLMKKVSRRWANPIPSFRAPAFEKVDLIKTNQISAAPLAAWAKERFGAKLITRCGYLWSYMAEKDGASDQEMDRILRRERTAFRTGDVCVVPTEHIRKMVVERHDVPVDRIHLIPNYVDTDIFCPSPTVAKEPGLILFVGRLEPQKNLPALIEAVSKANDHLTAHGKPDRYRLQLVGEGSEASRLKSLGAQLGLDVTFHDRMPNHKLPDILNRAEAFALVSHFEGYPKTSIEAMACGLPVIGSDISGTRDQITHGKTGYLCRTDVEAITNAILQVMADRKMRDELGKAARRQIVDTISLDATLQKELELYREVLTA